MVPHTASQPPQNARAIGEGGPPSEIRWSAPFEALAVGQRFRSVERIVGEADVIGFCALTGDWHPQHCDRDWAAAGPFGGRIAHGLLILSLAVGLVPFDPDRVVALRRVSDAVFKRPLHLDRTIVVEGELMSLSDVDAAGGLVGVRFRIVDQDAALVCRATVQVLWRRDGARSAGARQHWHEAVIGEAAADGFIPVPL
jgi:3-hydroxybutyryl-CoA dehydratase